LRKRKVREKRRIIQNAAMRDHEMTIHHSANPQRTGILITPARNEQGLMARSPIMLALHQAIDPHV